MEEMKKKTARKCRNTKANTLVQYSLLDLCIPNHNEETVHLELSVTETVSCHAVVEEQGLFNESGVQLTQEKIDLPCFLQIRAWKMALECMRKFLHDKEAVLDSAKSQVYTVQRTALKNVFVAVEVKQIFTALFEKIHASMISITEETRLTDSLCIRKNLQGNLHKENSIKQSALDIFLYSKVCLY